MRTSLRAPGINRRSGADWWGSYPFTRWQAPPRKRDGRWLEVCVVIADRMERNMRTLAVAVRTATHPSTGQAIFTLGDDEMEIGMGQHGEAGTGRMKLKTADETAETMLAPCSTSR